MENTLSKIVLIVDDDPLTRKILYNAVRPYASIIHECNDLKSTHEYLLSSTPHLILLDINLPDGNSLKFLEKEKPLFSKHTNILIITGNNDRYSIAKSITLGVKDYILKPVIPKKFAQKIKRILKDQKGLTLKYDNPVKAVIEVDATLLAASESELVFSSNITPLENTPLEISSNFMKNNKLRSCHFMTTNKFDNKFKNSSKLTVVSIIGLSPNDTTELRKKIMKWIKL